MYQIVLRNGDVTNWGVVGSDNQNSSVQLLQTLKAPFDGLDRDRVKVPGRNSHLPPPGGSMVHFTGRSKPWLTGAPEDLTRGSATKSAKHYWMWNLYELNEKLNLGLDLKTHWSTGKQRPPLGLYPVYDNVLNAQSNLLTSLQRVYPETGTDYRSALA